VNRKYIGEKEAVAGGVRGWWWEGEKDVGKGGQAGRVEREVGDRAGGVGDGGGRTGGDDERRAVGSEGGGGGGSGW